MAEHGTGGLSVVSAPHPDMLLVWCVLSCGCFRLFSPPPCFDVPGSIDAWFEARRGMVEQQMGGFDG